jgi:hypothetical protein
MNYAQINKLIFIHVIEKGMAENEDRIELNVSVAISACRFNTLG